MLTLESRNWPVQCRPWKQCDIQASPEAKKYACVDPGSSLAQRAERQPIGGQPAAPRGHVGSSGSQDVSDLHNKNLRCSHSDVRRPAGGHSGRVRRTFSSTPSHTHKMSKPQMNGFANGFSAPGSVHGTAAAGPRLRCGICQQKFSDPRVLPCLHSFCSACLRTIEPYAVGGAADDRDSGSMSVLNGSSFSLSVKGRDTTTILCPSCDIEVDIPKNGVEELPSDFIINNELVIASLNQEAEQILCGLCTDGVEGGQSRAIARCFECSVNLCGFCVQAHRRQKKTSVHNVLTLDEARQKGVGRVSQPVVCAVHPTEELRLFCQMSERCRREASDEGAGLLVSEARHVFRPADFARIPQTAARPTETSERLFFVFRPPHAAHTCDKLVCRDCCLAEHREHECAFVSTISDKHTSVMRDLLNQTEPNLDILRKALDGIAAMSLAVRDRAEKVASEVHQYTDSYVKALLMHRDALLDRIDQLREAKERNLRMHRVQLEAILADFSTACDFTSKALQEGSDVELLMVKPVVMKRLQELNHMKYNVKPKEDDFMKFYPKQPAGMCNGFEVFGGISAKSVDPGKSTAKGEGSVYGTMGQEENATISLPNMRIALGHGLTGTCGTWTRFMPCELLESRFGQFHVNKVFDAAACEPSYHGNLTTPTDIWTGFSRLDSWAEKVGRSFKRKRVPTVCGFLWHFCRLKSRAKFSTVGRSCSLNYKLALLLPKTGKSGNTSATRSALPPRRPVSVIGLGSREGLLKALTDTNSKVRFIV
ncbi:Tripartite motif-containing protein 45 [Branchiostoma belcheri]|nr:Tripartite motif-containing protein 45 [Branchiostoma belcheri]